MNRKVTIPKRTPAYLAFTSLNSLPPLCMPSGKTPPPHLFQPVRRLRPNRIIVPTPPTSSHLFTSSTRSNWPCFVRFSRATVGPPPITRVGFGRTKRDDIGAKSEENQRGEAVLIWAFTLSLPAGVHYHYRRDTPATSHDLESRVWSMLASTSW